MKSKNFTSAIHDTLGVKFKISQGKQLTEDKQFTRLNCCQGNVLTAWHKVFKLSQLLKTHEDGAFEMSRRVWL